MARNHSPREDVESEPTTFIFTVRLINQFRGTESLPQILRLQELCVRTYFTNGSHRQNNSATLREKSPRETQGILGVGIPMTVERTKACGRQRFIDWRKFRNPREALSYRPCILSE